MKTNPFDRLPDSVEVDGVAFPVNTDFRMGVSIELELLEKTNPDVSGLLQQFYYGCLPGNIDEAAKQMVWFFGGGDTPPPLSSEKYESRKRVYDYRQDSEVIIASFYLAYGIDLTREDLHWWAFRQLLWNLPRDTPFKERIHYRVADTSKMGKTERKRYKKLQSMYAIKEIAHTPLTVEDAEQAMLDKINRAYERAQKEKQPMTARIT